jgi:hypothetical protein
VDFQPRCYRAGFVLAFRSKGSGRCGQQWSERPKYTDRIMRRRLYLSIEALLRLLAAAGGLWILLLLAAIAAWATSHMIRWWICALIDASATLCLLVGAATVRFRRRILVVSNFCGACAVASLGLASMLTQGDHSSASLLFALTFFVLTVSMPLCVAALCVYDFRHPFKALVEPRFPEIRLESAELAAGEGNSRKVWRAQPVDATLA